MRSRSSSILSTADEELLETNNIGQEKTDIDTLFDLVHDLKQKDLEEHKLKLEQAQSRDLEKVEPEPTLPEPEERKFNFKHLSGVGPVQVLNLSKKEDLEKKKVLL